MDDPLNHRDIMRVEQALAAGEIPWPHADAVTTLLRLARQATDSEEMVERVARAIYEAAPVMAEVIPYDELSSDVKDGERRAARAALQAIRTG